MKKLLKGLGIFFLLIIAALIFLPMIFKDEIVQAVKDAANENLNATVDFGDFDISIFSDFPDLTVTVNDVVVRNKHPFEGVTLADIGALDVTIDLFSVFGDTYEIVSFGITEGDFDVQVMEDGTANWDIAMPSEEGEEDESETTDDSGFAIGVQRYFIKNSNLVYDDRSLGQYVKAVNMSHEGSADFTADETDLESTTTIDALTYAMDGIPYLSGVNTEADFNMHMNLPEFKFTFTDNMVRLNALALHFEGWVAMPDDPIDMDITFATEQSEFKNFLSLVPAVYARDFEDIQTRGTLALDGFAKGRSDEESIPGFELNLQVNDARFQYPDLPKSAENIAIDLHVNNPGGDPDATVVDLRKFHTDLGENPIDMVLLVKNPVSDPYINANVEAQLSLANLSDVIPMEEGESYSGSITSNIHLDGRQSAIDNEDFEAFKASGDLILLDMKYQSPDLPYAIDINSAYLKFAPQFVQLTNFDALIGETDIKANGEILNMLGWYFGEQSLEGRFDLASNNMNLDEFMEEEEEGAGEAEAESSEEGVVEVPGDVDFTMTATIGKLMWDGLEMKDVNGGMHIHDHVLDMRDLEMKTLQGMITVSGKYETKDPRVPFFSFDLDIDNCDVQETFAAFNTIQKLAPIAQHCDGKFSTISRISAVMDANMDPIMETMNGKGRLRTHSIDVQNNNTVLGKIGDELKMPDIHLIDLEDANLSYEIKDGRVFLDPFDSKVGNVSSILGGSHGFDQTMDYVMNLSLPMGALGKQAKGAIQGLVDKANAAGGKFSVDDMMDVDVFIGGTITNPIIRPGIKGSGGNLKEDVKEAVKEQVTEAVEEAKEQAKETANEEIEKQIEDIMAKAEAEANKVRAAGKAAAEKAREEGYKLIDDQIEKAKGPEKLALKAGKKKAQQAVDTKADKIEQEANDQADKILEEARKRSEELRVK